jgi:hypothetical protein
MLKTQPARFPAMEFSGATGLLAWMIATMVNFNFTNAQSGMMFLGKKTSHPFGWVAVKRRQSHI